MQDVKHQGLAPTELVVLSLDLLLIFDPASDICRKRKLLAPEELNVNRNKYK